MLLGCLVACGPLAILNSPPSVQLESPAPGALVSHSAPLTFVASVDDDYTPLDELTVLWTLADGTPLAGSLVLDAAAKSLSFTPAEPLPRGEPTVTLRVIDGMGESARSSVKLLVFDDVAPTVEWAHPVDGGVYAGGFPLDVSVTITDPDPLEDTSLRLEWSGSALSAADEVPDSLPASGTVAFTLDGLSLATWPLQLTVTDALGASTTSEVRFQVINADVDNDDHLSAAAEGGDDCDDTSSAVHPGVPERCNGVDDDCDGLVDEEATDAPTWYGDADGDGYGNPADAYAHCEAVGGRVADAEDCDDGNAAVNPAAVEVCNGVDDDCDGDEDTTAVDRVTVWLDFDEDGYGAGAAYTVCEPRADEVDNADDCDDGNDAVHPGAAEVCDARNVDEDCNGVADDDDAGATGRVTVYADGDGDHHGDPATTADRCDVGTGWATTADDCDDAEADAWTGAAEVCEDGVDNDCTGGDAGCRLAGDVDLSLADAAYTGDILTLSGSPVVGLGDVDGDGLDDAAVGAWGGDSVYVIPGGSLASGSLSAAGRYTAEASGDDFGWSLAGVGDVDGDGRADLLVGAVGHGGGGAAYLFTGSVSGGAASAAMWSVAGAAGEKLGAGVAGGTDVDGDGAADVLVGGAGFVSVRRGSSGDKLATWSSGGTGVGSVVAVAPDVDGDGLDDLLVGDSGDDVAYLVYAGLPGDLDLALADGVFTAETTGDQAGAAVSGAGDVDGDGHGDVLIGAPSRGAAGSTSGAAYLLTWTAGSGVPSGSLAGATSVFTGEDAADRAGTTVAGPGDVDGDGRDDLLVGAPYDETGGTGAGAAYLVYGASVAAGTTSLSAADARFLGESAGDEAGAGLGGPGDLDGDGFADLAFGAPGTGSAAGTVYFVLGGGL